MKKTLLLLAALLALAIGAGAQGVIDFADLPGTPGISTPNPMPHGYAGLNWSGFYYVNPFAWSGAGPGFKHKEWMMGPDVVFAPFGCAGLSCYASLSVGSSALPPGFPGAGFHLITAMAAAGYPTMGMGGSPLIVTAYRNGKYVGRLTYMMTTDAQSLDFPSEWGSVTQVVFQGSIVLYNITVYVN
jgi:hypothetical protein